MPFRCIYAIPQNLELSAASRVVLEYD